MADFNLITFDATNDRKKKQDSASITIDFTAVRIGSSELTISETTGAFDFNSTALVGATSIAIGGSALVISEDTGALDVNSVRITGVSTPTADSDAANKAYVDGVAQGLDVKHSAKTATTAALPAVTAAGSGVGKTLTADAVGVLTVDGIATWTDIDNDAASADPFAASPASRVLVKDQATAADNGIYAVKEKGDGGTAFILIRGEDIDENAEITAGAFTFIEEGSAFADTGWVLSTDDPISIDVTSQAWTQFSGAGAFTGGDGINISGSVIEVDLSAASGLEISGSTLQVDLEAAGSGTGGLELNGNEIRVDAGLGLELLAGGVTVDLEAAGSGTGGLAFNGNEILVDVSTGLELTGSGVAVDLEAAGSGTGGLELNGNEIRVDVSTGLELLAGGVTVDLEAAGAGEGGLTFDGNEIRVNVGDGVVLTASGVEADLAAAGAGTGGLEIVSSEIAVNAGDGLLLDANGVAIDLLTASGLQLSASDGSGELSVDLEAAGAGAGGLELVGNEIAVIAGDGIELTASGVAADLAASGSGTGGLEIVSNEIAVNPGLGIELTAAGVAADINSTTGGLTFNGNEIQVDIEAAGVGEGGLAFDGNELRVFVGDGIQLTASGVEADLAAAGAGTGGLEIVGGEIAVDAGDGIQLTSAGVAADYSDAFTNDNAGAITVRQVVYIKADGDVDLAKNDIADLDDFELGIVEDASIAAAASGNITIRRGAVIGGFSGLTPGKKQYVSDATAGALTESLAGFVATEFVYSVGRAKSATELIFDPHFEFEF